MIVGSAFCCAELAVRWTTRRKALNQRAVHSSLRSVKRWRSVVICNMQISSQNIAHSDPRLRGAEITIVTWPLRVFNVNQQLIKQLSSQRNVLRLPSSRRPGLELRILTIPAKIFFRFVVNFLGSKDRIFLEFGTTFLLLITERVVAEW